MTSLLFKVELEPDTFNRGGIFSFQAYALMNEREQAIKWLDVTADDGFPCYPLFEKDANLDNLRQDARFVRFLAKQRESSGSITRQFCEDRSSD